MKKEYKVKLAEKNEVDETLTFVMGRFNAARDYARKGFWSTWKGARKLYNSQRVAVNYAGNSDTFVPETFTIIQSVKSNVIGGKIKTIFLPTRRDQTGDTKTLNALSEQWWVQDKTKLKCSWAMDDSLVVGNGYLWQYWNGKYPCNTYVPTEDNFFDPQATNYSNLRYGGYRYLTTMDDLKAEKITNPDYNSEDEKSEARVSRYKNLDKISEYGKVGIWKKGNDKTSKQLREEMTAGSVLGTGVETSDIIEVIVYYDKKQQVRIANRCTVIEEVDTWAKRDATVINSQDDAGRPIPVEIPEIEPFIPVAPARDYVDGAMWYARGEVEVIGDLQELLNDTQNQKTDNLSYSQNQMVILDPSQSHKINEIQSAPGAVLTLPPGSIEFLTKPNIGADADNEMYRLQSMMRRATAADELVQGSGSTGATTATEVNATLNMAGTRFGSKLENYESEFFAILSNNMFKIAQIFMTTEEAVRMVGQKGVEWKNYNPGEYLGNWDVKVALEGTARYVQEEEKQSAMQFYLMASKQPFVNQEQLFKMTATALFDKDDQEIDKLVQQVAPVTPKKIAPKVSISYKDITDPQAREALVAQAITAGPSIKEEQPQGMGQAPGQPDMSQMPQSNAENAVSADVQQGAGINVPGMPQA